MSDNKRGADDEGTARPAGAPDLNKAMADAMRAVEAREREANAGRNGGEGDPEITEDSQGSSGRAESPKSAAEAVTESLLQAKRELEDVLAQTQTEAKSMREKWLRAAADLENYKKRAQKEREEVQKFGNERLLRDFLPVIDDLDRVISSTKPGDPQMQAMIDGLKLVRKKFIDQLEKHGVTTFAAEGQPFDPNLHEAVQQVHADVPAGTAVTQLQRGYMMGGRLLRPALVTVSLGPAPAPDGAKKDQG